MSNLTRKIMTTKKIETDIEGCRLLLAAIEESKVYFKRMQTEISKLGPAMWRLVMAYQCCPYNDCKPKKYLRTGITPKWSNRTRKKQRLTRLQRRHKRQRK